MKLFVGITDNDWYRHLAAQPGIDEVNFWQPGGQKVFRALQPGEPFLFKLHAPENYIAGGAFFAHCSILPSSLAWDAFGTKNGVDSLAQMRTRIAKYRRRPLEPGEDPPVGCIALVQPFFFDRAAWIATPPEFAKSIQVGKTFDTADPAGARLWAAVRERLGATVVGVAEPVETEMYGAPTLIRPRLGQGTFRILITDTYDRRCAVTAEKAIPVLEAAHIRPVARGGFHHVDNGLLLRSDIHTLYDRGYLTIAPDHRIHVSPRLKTDFDDGENYRKLEGSVIRLPHRPDRHPNPQALEWHADTVFLR